MERLTSHEVFHSNAREERAQIASAEFHPRLLGDLVADEDQRLGAPLRDRVANILHRLPLARLAGNEHLHAGLTDRLYLPFKPDGTWFYGSLRHLELRVTFHAYRFGMEAILQLLDELAERDTRKRDEVHAR